MGKFFVVLAAVLGILPFAAKAQAECPQIYNGVTFVWQEECEVIADIHRTKQVGGEVSDNSPAGRPVAIVRVCRQVCGGLDYVIEPNDPREFLYRISGDRACVAPGEDVHKSPNPGAALAELSEETRKRCEPIIAEAIARKQRR